MSQFLESDQSNEPPCPVHVQVLLMNLNLSISHGRGRIAESPMVTLTYLKRLGNRAQSYEFRERHVSGPTSGQLFIDWIKRQ